jgi:hypothetical protein
VETKGTRLNAPKNVQIEFTVRATHASPTGDRVPLAPRVSFAAKPGGMTIHLEWGQLGEAAAPAASVDVCSALPDDAASVAEAQQWLEQKMRAWSGRA